METFCIYIGSNNYIIMKSEGMRPNLVYKPDTTESSSKLDGDNKERNALNNIPIIDIFYLTMGPAGIMICNTYQMSSSW